MTQSRYHRKGSNQYKARSRWVDNPLTWLWVLLAVILFGVILHYWHGFEAWAEAPKSTLGYQFSPLVASGSAELVPSVTPTVSPTPTQHELIIDEIKRVFGADAPKAFRLLSCENSGLRPNVVNVNNDPEHTHDVGIFQINTKWQGVTNEAFLADYTINIRMAYNIYSRDGYTFKLWTCGRMLGI